MRKINRILVAIGVSLVPISSYGETLAEAEKEVITLPTVEVVGSAERLPEIAGSASILYEEDLSRVFTVHEALRKVPGVNIRDEEGFAIRPNIGLRGLNPTRSTKVLLLEDGLPLAYAPYGDNASYYHPPIDRFERVEVLKGSEQILFGPQTIGGVINYITPAPLQEFGGRLALTGGNRDYFNGHLGLGGKGLLLDVLQKQGDGSRDNEELELTDVNLKGVFNWGTRHGLTLRANYYREDSDVTYTEKKLLQEIVVERELVFYDTVTSPHAHVYGMDSGELRDLDIHLDLHTFPDDAVVEGAHVVLLVRSHPFEKASAHGGSRV